MDEEARRLEDYVAPSHANYRSLKPWMATTPHPQFSRQSRHLVNSQRHHAGNLLMKLYIMQVIGILECRGDASP